MTSISVHFRPSSRSGYHPGSLFIRVIRFRKVKTLTLRGFHLYRDEWDASCEQVVLPSFRTSRTDYLLNLDRRLRQCLFSFRACEAELCSSGEFSASDIIEAYLHRIDEKSISHFVSHLAQGLESAGRYRTAQAYRCTCRRLLGASGRSDLPISAINAELMQVFEQKLKADGCMENTISFYMRNLRAIYNKASAKGLLSGTHMNPFTKVYTGIAPTEKRALNITQVSRIIDYNASPDPAISVCSRLFSFCFYASGMCFVDLAFLKKENIQDGIITYKRRKTGKNIAVRITGQMQRIIDSFAADTAGSPYLFPIIRSENAPARKQYESALRVQNHRLKKIAMLEGIGKNLSTHVARHSWATIGRKEDIPIPVLCDCLGHSSEHVTRIYLDSFESEVLHKANLRITEAVSSACFGLG